MKTRSHRITSQKTTTSRHRPTGRLVTIQGEQYNLDVAKFRFCCWICEASLKVVNHGLKCTKSEYHYGQIEIIKAASMTRGELNMSMADLFKNRTGLMREIDMTPEGFVAEITLVGLHERPVFKSREKEQVCVLSLKGYRFKVRIPESYGMLLFEKWGDPGDPGDPKGAWVGKYVRVYLNMERNGQNEANVVRVAPSNQKPKNVIDVSKLDKNGMVNYCLDNLDIYIDNRPKIKEIMPFIIFVLSNGGVVGEKYSPQAAYDEMVTTGQSLHKFLAGLDCDYQYAFEWMQTSGDKGMPTPHPYSPKLKDEITAYIYASLQADDREGSDLMRGDDYNDSDPLAEGEQAEAMGSHDDYTEFVNGVIETSDYYTDSDHVETVMTMNNVFYQVQTDDTILSVLEAYAKKQTA